MNIYQVGAKNFALVVKVIKREYDNYEAFELNLDDMKVKGDLAVLQKYFEKPLIGRTSDLAMAKKVVKSELAYVRIPAELELDLDFENLVKNKGVGVLN